MMVDYELNWGIKIETVVDNVFENNSISGCNYSVIIKNHAIENTINNNTISDGKYGFFMNYAFRNEINGNVVSSCEVGMNMHYSENNTLFNNTYTGSNTAIIVENFSVNNSFYNNKFTDNYLHANDSCFNFWDYSGIGNFWDDYLGSDLDEDGIGDDPYYILGGDNLDRYPLIEAMNPQ